MYEVLAFPTPNAQTTRHVKTTIVLIHARHLVVRVLIVGPKTMLQFADAHGETQEIHFRHAEDLQKTRSVKHVAPIQTVR